MKLKMKMLLNIFLDLFSNKRVFKDDNQKYFIEVKKAATNKNYKNLVPLGIAVILAVLLLIIADLISGAYRHFDVGSSLKLASMVIFFVSSLTAIILYVVKGQKASGRMKRAIYYAYFCAIALALSLFLLADTIHEVKSITIFFVVVVLGVIPVLPKYLFSTYLAIYYLPSFIYNAWNGTFNYLDLCLLACCIFVSASTRVSFGKATITNLKFANYNEELEVANLTDALTGLGNRTKLYKVLEENQEKWIKENQEACLIMCDIDNFKNYNDSFSHLKGDDCLIKVSNAMKDILEEEGVDFEIIRFGGEEFLIFITGDDLESKMVELYQKMKKRIAFLHIKSGFGATHPYVTVSFGVTIFNIDYLFKLEDQIRQADAQLYLSKENGRNVLFYKGHPYI